MWHVIEFVVSAPHDLLGKSRRAQMYALRYRFGLLNHRLNLENFF
jgi:hypothetical protein